MVGAVSERVRVADLPDVLLSAGVHAFSTEDAARAAGVSVAGVRPGLARLVRKRLVFSPARGLYVAVPPQFRSWGVVPADWFIDALMGHLGRAYYVGYLSAGEVHEAAHQRPQTFQVVVDRDVRDRQFGRVRLGFITNTDAALLPVVRVNTPTGTMAVATPELTLFDLASRPERGGGLDNIATVAVELAGNDKLNDAELAALAPRFAAAAVRRAGWIVETFTTLRLDALADTRSGATVSLLDPHGPRRGPTDPRWGIQLNAEIEPET